MDGSITEGVRNRIGGVGTGGGRPQAAVNTLELSRRIIGGWWKQSLSYSSPFFFLFFLFVVVVVRMTDAAFSHTQNKKSKENVHKHPFFL